MSGRVHQSLGTLRRARKSYACEGNEQECMDRIYRIEPGDYYVRAACPPGHDAIGNDKWWSIRLCLTCAFRSGYDTACNAPTGTADGDAARCRLFRGHDQKEHVR